MTQLIPSVIVGGAVWLVLYIFGKLNDEANENLKLSRSTDDLSKDVGV